ncbi:MAG: hypothetical protein AAF568_03095, partial [Pseudomonadota bacterium]
ELNHDSVQVGQKQLVRIDVLANDRGVSDEDAQRLAVVSTPKCGNVFVQGGALQYLPNEDCTQLQTITYQIAGSPNDAIGVVQIRIQGAPAIGNTEPVRLTEEPARVAQNPQPSQPVTETVVAGVEQPIAVARQPQPSFQAPQAELDQPGAVVIGQTPVAPPPRQTSTLSFQPGQVDQPQVAISPQAPQPSAPQSPQSPGQLAVLSQPGAPSINRSQPVQTRDPNERPLSIDPVNRNANAPSGPAQPVTRDAWQNQQTDLAALSQPAAPTLGGAIGAGSGVEDGANVSVARVELREPRRLNLDAPALRHGDERGVSPSRALVGVGTTSRPVVPQTQIAALQQGNTRAFGRARQPLIDREIPLAEPDLAVTSIPNLSVPRLGDRRAPRISGPQLSALTPAAPIGGRLQLPDEPSFSLSTVAPRELEPGPPLDTRPEPQPEPAPDPEIAALTPASQLCVTPPAMTLGIQSAAQTEIVVVAPCHPNEVVELTYSGLTFAIPTDKQGNGTFMALGFEASSQARLILPDGETMRFEIPFKEVGRVTRFALTWDMPVKLNLHALEFGAEPFSADDVNPDNPRSFEDVRRSGGGYIHSHTPIDGKGAFVQIYTHYLTRRGKSGIVELVLDFVSRDREGLASACGAGDLAKPKVTTFMSEQGSLDRPRLRRLASVPCGQIIDGPVLSELNKMGSMVITP